MKLKQAVSSKEIKVANNHNECYSEMMQNEQVSRWSLIIISKSVDIYLLLHMH